MRESDDPESLSRRIHSAWRSIFDRTETNIAIVAHSAFFMHQFQPYHQRLQNLIEYGDQEVQSLMTTERFGNCEIRSVIAEPF